jgi:hypothetical protein
MAIGIELGRAWMRQSEAKKQRELQDEQRQRQEGLDEEAKLQRELQRTAMEASLRAQGIIPETEQEGITLPGLQVQQQGQGVGQATAPVQTNAQDPSRYKALTPGRVLDTQQTPEAKQARERAQQLLLAKQQESQTAALMRAAMGGDEDAKAKVLMQNPSFANTIFKPKEEKAPQRYQPTTREEALSFEEDRAKIAARYRPAQQPAAQSARSFTQAMRIADQYRNDPTVKNAAIIAENFEKIRGVAKAPSAAGDISLVFSYMKMLDPGSTVREGEFATAQNAAGVPDRVRNAYNKAQTGEFLSPKQRNDFIQQAMAVATAQRKLVGGVSKRYGAIASRYGVDPSEIVYDPFDVSLGATAPAPAGMTPEQWLKQIRGGK